MRMNIMPLTQHRLYVHHCTKINIKMMPDITLTKLMKPMHPSWWSYQTHHGKNDGNYGQNRAINNAKKWCNVWNFGKPTPPHRKESHLIFIIFNNFCTKFCRRKITAFRVKRDKRIMRTLTEGGATKNKQNKAAVVDPKKRPAIPRKRTCISHIHRTKLGIWKMKLLFCASFLGPTVAN